MGPPIVNRGRDAFGIRRILLGLALVGAACQAGPPAPATTPPSGAATARATPAASRMPTSGTLRVALPTDIGLLDPGAGDQAAEPILRQLYEGLVERVGERIVGRLATAWSVAPDGRTWRFTLRGDVRFHDGAPFDAAAAARSLTLRASEGVIESATATGPATVVVVTRTPLGSLLSLLGTPRYAIVGTAGPARAAAPPPGTGPFLLRPGTETARPLTLERNPAYWRTDPGGTALPYLDRLVFLAYPDAAARVAALRSGAVDLVTELAFADVPAVRTDPSLQLVARPPTTVLFLGLNLAQPPLDDLRVRQAIAAGLNRRALVDRPYAGAAEPATQFPPPGTLGHDDSIREFSRNDPTTAKALLAQAGRPTIELELWYPQGAGPSQPDLRRVAEAIAADLAAIGITANLRTIDRVTFVLSLRDGRYPLWLDTATMIAGDPDEILGRLFLPPGAPVVGAPERPTQGGWIDREAFGLLRKAGSEPDESKRAELYKQVSKIVGQKVPGVPLVWSAPPAAATKKVLDPSAFWWGAAAIGK